MSNSTATTNKQEWADALFNRHETNKAGVISFQWKQDALKAIKLGLFSEFVSAHTEAKQLVIILLTKAGFKVNAEAIGCTVVRITIDNSKGK